MQILQYHSVHIVSHFLKYELKSEKNQTGLSDLVFSIFICWAFPSVQNSIQGREKTVDSYQKDY